MFIIDCFIVFLHHNTMKGWFLYIFLLLGIHVLAQQTPYAIHANIVYHFTKYINWPDDKKLGDFVIGIVGESPLQQELKRLISNKSAGGQRIVIKSFPPPPRLLTVIFYSSARMKAKASNILWPPRMGRPCCW